MLLKKSTFCLLVKLTDISKMSFDKCTDGMLFCCSVVVRTIHTGWGKCSGFAEVSKKNDISGVQKGKKLEQHQRKIAVLTLFLWTLQAFVETPGCPNGRTALLLLSETWQSLPALLHGQWHMGEREKDGKVYYFYLMKQLCFLCFLRLLCLMPRSPHIDSLLTKIWPGNRVTCD